MEWRSGKDDAFPGKINPPHTELNGATGVYGSHPTGVHDMDYQIAFAATVATASFLVFMLVVHRT
ncbi:hypothetical protein CO657_09120 [Rhizobium acidisoli]|uniref:Uncharacterized protein n=1 Tax=Rhizobium acidisoli TaxID=1538158 RepID=A0AAE5TUZ4_9HYPH|nr:hypothetical protein AOG23_13835 [Rhizobium acidisoli]QAS78219.1 hypothetical protein CO657_09120 [Rhizobium acidisoli]